MYPHNPALFKREDFQRDVILVRQRLIEEMIALGVDPTAVAGVLKQCLEAKGLLLDKQGNEHYYEDYKVRLAAAREVNKILGTHAPDKHLNVTLTDQNLERLAQLQGQEPIEIKIEPEEKKE